MEVIFLTTRQANMTIAASDGIKKAMELFDGVDDGATAAALMKSMMPWDDSDRNMGVERAAFCGYIFQMWQKHGCPELSNDTP